MTLTQKLLLLLLVACCCSCRWACGYSSPPRAAVCPGSGTPVPLPLGFCGNVGLSCCDSAADAALRGEFDAMKVHETDAACATIVKAILCQRCIPSPSPQPPVNAATINSIPPRCTSPTPSSSSAPPQPQQDGVCLERLAAGGNTYLGMAAHPDGSGGAFLYTQEGKVWLVSVPPRGSGAAINVAAGDGAVPFLDLTDRGLMLMGLALHPQFDTNGRLFISYASGTAAGGNGSGWPSGNQLVLAEFSVNPVDHGTATRAEPTEARRIFTMGLPQLPDASGQQYGGQIFFGPGHGCLYLVSGPGGDEATSPFVGRIIRFNVDRMPGSEPEIFATGLSKPRGCSFDSEKPSHMYCGGVDKQGNEQVYLISDDTAASNYNASTANKAAVSLIIDHGHPTAGEAPSIAGGIVYRGLANPLLNARYLYIYASSLWAAAETPASNGLSAYQTARISNVRCSGSSPVPCGDVVGITGNIVSLGQDHSKDALIITTGGIYRVIPPILCATAPHAAPSSPPPPPPQKVASSWLVWAASILGSAATPFAIYLVYSCLGGSSGGGGEGQPTSTNSCAVTCNCCSLGTRDDKSDAPLGGRGQGGSTGTQVELATRM